MKKRILSIALAVVMVVVMLPVAVISAFAGYHIVNETAIDTYYGDADITIDGQRDAIYTQSEATKNHYTSGYSGFEGYFVATDDGLYFYAEILDKTIGYEYMQYNPNRGNGNDVSNQDKIQVYYNFADAWGYVEFDYFYNNADATFLPGDLADAKPLHHARFKHVTKTTTIDTNAVESYFTAATTVDLEAGKWTAEFFLPWDVADFVDGSAAPYAAAVGVQVNNDRWEMGKAKVTRDGLSYNGYTGNAWYNGPNSSDFIALKYIGVDVPSTANGQYTTKVTSNPLTVDGQLDDIYLQGDMITNGEYIYKADHVEEIPAYTGFKAYTAATLDGFYVYLDVNDETMNNITETDPFNDGDRVQFYFDMTPAGYRHDDGLYVHMTGSSRDYEGNGAFDGGWIGVDYNGNFGGVSCGKNLNDMNSLIDFEVVKRENPDWDGTDSKTQYVGYIVEMFIPWTPWMANAIGRQDVAHFGFGIEVQDDCTYDDGVTRGVICGNDGFLSYYFSASILPDIVFDYGTTPEHLNHHYGAIVDEATVDGVNTAGEYDGAQVIHVNLQGGGTADDGDIYRIITDGEAIYVLCEMVDTTPSDHTKQLGSYMDYCDMFFSFGTRLATYASFYRDYYSKKETGELDPVTYQPIIQYTYANVRSGYNGGSIAFHPDLGNFAVVDNREAGWSFEIKIDLTAEEQAQLAAGTLEIGMSAQFLDGYTPAEGQKAGDARNYKYDVYGGGNFWNLGAYVNRFAPVRFVASNLMDVEADLTGAQVALGESISVNFFANLSAYDTDAKLKVTFNGKDYVLGAQKTDVADEYKFVFEGIAPQCMGDLLDAELIVDGVVVESITDYSVRQNCLNIIDAGADAKTQQLIADLAAYGAAAQLAANYKTDDLVNAGFEGYATEITAIENNDKTVSEAVEGFEFTAAGVYFDNTNKLYVKAVIDAEALDYVTVTIDGVEATLIATGNENEYIVYTDDIVVTDFDKVYTFVITDGTDSQTVTYSVNAYCDAKLDSAKYDTTKALVAATYAYGLSAEAYVA